jgi:hypothetical protein
LIITEYDDDDVEYSDEYRIQDLSSYDHIFIY